ncbi:hypothetical protein EB796_023091 [Bugula neritina]|uniref:SVEP1 n=1 Tax=Bugula neritina TaxID=10212 RepID=A0A7J7IXE6_BUGNE|nr:hypothetical protein EB796_023091 [Bugula neritina]
MALAYPGPKHQEIFPDVLQIAEEELDSAECYFTSDLGYSYDGEVNTGCGGSACMSWDHYLIEDLFVRHVQEDSRLVRNYEGSGYTKPWCYVEVAAETIDGITRPSYITRQASGLPKCRIILEIERASLLSDSSMFLRFLYLNSYLCVNCFLPQKHFVHFLPLIFANVTVIGDATLSSNDIMLHGYNLHVECTTGYYYYWLEESKNVTELTITCQEDNNWNTSISKCVSTECYGKCKNGWCVLTEMVCNCTGTGYTGPECDIPVCEANCSNHGVCSSPNNCSCHEGYDGEFCEKKLFCDPPLIIENAEHNLNTSSDLQWPINQAVMYSCKGESVHYNGSLEGSCNVNTTWDFTEGEPHCYNICTCGNYSLNTSSNIISTYYNHTLPSGVSGLFPGAKINFSCPVNYAYVGDNSTSHCEQTAPSECNWSNIGDVFCQKLFCDPPLIIENTEHNLNTSNNLQWPINQTVMYSCKGESVHYNGSLEGSCNVNTTWDFTEGEPHCYNICTCGNYSLNTSSNIISTYYNHTLPSGVSGLFPGAKINFSCPVNYAYVGDNSTSHCEQTAPGECNWSNIGNFFCQKLYCEYMTSPSNGSVIHQSPSSILYNTVDVAGINSTYRVECDEGFLPDTNYSVTCVANITGVDPVWNQPRPECNPACFLVNHSRELVEAGLINITLPQMHYNLLNKDWVPIGTELTVICGKNTLPLLKPTIVCELSENVANWNDTLPECKASFCTSRPHNITNGYTYITNHTESEQYPPGTIFSMNCSMGYVGSVVNYTMCVWDEETGLSDWTNSSHHVCYKTFCEIPAPNAVEFASFKVKFAEEGNFSSSIAQNGTKLRFTCDEGYTLTNGSLAQVCRRYDGEDASWRRRRPTCSRVKCSYSLGNGTESSSDLPDLLDYGEILTVNCKEGLFPYYGDYERQCLQSGQLSGIQLNCFANMFASVCFTATPCESPTLNKHVDVEWELGGKRITFKCEEGYKRLSGNREMNCQPNGKWIGEPLACFSDGEWSSWSNWDPLCSIIYTHNTSRTRSCTNPAPFNGGQDCAGSINKQTLPCRKHLYSFFADGIWSKWSTVNRYGCQTQLCAEGDTMLPTNNPDILCYCTGRFYSCHHCLYLNMSLLHV